MGNTVEMDNEVLLAQGYPAGYCSNAHNTELQESSSQLCGALRMISRGAGPKRNAVCEE